MQMINHGLSTGGLFLLVGMLYERYHTRKIADYGGMAARLPLLGVFMVFICLSSVGLPGLNGFIGEALVLLGIFDHQWTEHQWPVLAVRRRHRHDPGGLVSDDDAAARLLRPGEGTGTTTATAIRDLDGRELGIIVPIAVLCLALGVYPQPCSDHAAGRRSDCRHRRQRGRKRQRPAAAADARPSPRTPAGGEAP